MPNGDLSSDDTQAVIEELTKRLDHVEEFLTHLVGYRYTPYTATATDSVPDDIRGLARAGKTIEAIKRYRAATGASAEQATAVVRSL